MPPRNKLTESQVRLIHRDQRHPGKIAKEYGVTQRAVLNIKRGVSWRHLKLGPTKHYADKAKEKAFATQDPRPQEAPHVE